MGPRVLHCRIEGYVLPPYRIRHLYQKDLFGPLRGALFQRRYIIYRTVGKALFFQPAAAEGMAFGEDDQTV